MKVTLKNMAEPVVANFLDGDGSFVCGPNAFTALDFRKWELEQGSML
jgi:hypothetical protein